MEIEMKIVFKDMKSVMCASKNSTYFEFPGIKRGLDATVIAIKVNKDEGIEIATQDITTGINRVNLSFEKIESFDALKLILAQLDL